MEGKLSKALPPWAAVESAPHSITFGWYQPQYLSITGSSSASPPSATEEGGNRCFFPTIVDAILHRQQPTAKKDNSTSKREEAAGVDWTRVTPMGELWDGPPIPAKLPVPHDIVRLLGRAKRRREEKAEDEVKGRL